MYKVFVGVGHGGNDPGAVGYIKEADVNLNMAVACRDYLVANGVEVKMSRTRDENDDLNEEIRECNAYNPDLAVDIHNNAGGGDGFEAFYSIGGGIGKTLADNIEKEIKAINQNSRGCKTKQGKNGDYYGFIRCTKAPAVIVEGVFVDNKNDAAQADTLEEQKAFGIAYAKGILKTLGITSNNKPATTQGLVAQWQAVMNACYGCNLAVDNSYGPDSKAKANKYQLYYNQKAIINNEHVRFIQQRLNAFGYKLEEDAFFGPLTSNAVKQFQKAKKLSVDGYVGANTTKKLLNL